MFHHFYKNTELPFADSYVTPTQSLLFVRATPDELQLPASAALSDLYLADFTMSFWVKPGASFGGLNTIFSSLNDPAPRLGLFFTGTVEGLGVGLQIRHFGDDGVGGTVVISESTTSNTSMTIGTWSHIIITYDISDHLFRVYENNIEPAYLFQTYLSGQVPASDVANVKSIGAGITSTFGLDGNLLHFSVWEGFKADASQRAAIYNGGVLFDPRLLNLPSSLSVFYPLDGTYSTSGGTIEDISSNGSDMTDVGTIALDTDVP